MAAFLLHSLHEFREVIFELVDRLEVKRVLEVGVESGQMSAALLARGLELTSVDPAPYGTALPPHGHYYHQARSLDYFATNRCKVPELVLLDGDHNYYTVRSELEACFRDGNLDRVVLVHDVGWPWGRRDMYYDPASIPTEHRHPSVGSPRRGPLRMQRHGIRLGDPGLVLGGFHGAGHFVLACEEGGARNGVLTAVEDFITESPYEFGYVSIDAVFGLGAVFYQITDGRTARVVREVFARYDNPLVRRLEQNRLELYGELLRRQSL